MGIVILPFLLASLILFIIAVFKSVKLIISKSIEIVEVFYGFLMSIVLYLVIALCYFILDKAWALSPFFVLPIVMIFAPFLFHIGFENSKSAKEKSISKIILLSIIITSLFGTLSYNIFFDIINHVGTHKSY